MFIDVDRIPGRCPVILVSTQSISFVVACLNNAAGIKITLQSILVNALPCDAVLVIDGGSSDKTVEIASAELQNWPSAQVISEPDRGIYDAWNKALLLNESDWVAFLGCGDTLETNYRSKMMSSATMRNANLIHSLGRFYNFQGSSKVLYGQLGGEFDRASLRNKMRFCHVGALHHRSLFLNMTFSTSYTSVSDYHFLLQQHMNLKPYFVSAQLVMVEMGGVSTSGMAPIIEEFRMKREFGGYNIFKLYLATLANLIRIHGWRLKHYIHGLRNVH